jgi:hypothetical protein
MVVCIGLDFDVGWFFGAGPCPPLYSLEGQGYMKILAKYELRSPTRMTLR